MDTEKENNSTEDTKDSLKTELDMLRTAIESNKLSLKKKEKLVEDLQKQMAELRLMIRKREQAVLIWSGKPMINRVYKKKGDILPTLNPKI
jgi:chromosome segregation ATPase